MCQLRLADEHDLPLLQDLFLHWGPRPRCRRGLGRFDSYWIIVAFFNYGQVSREEVMSHREQARAERHVT